MSYPTYLNINVVNFERTFTLFFQLAIGDSWKSWWGDSSVLPRYADLPSLARPTRRRTMQWKSEGWNQLRKGKTWRTEIYRILFKLLDTLMVLRNWHFWPSNKSIGSYTTPTSVIVRKTATWQRFNHGEILKERGNSSKHQNSAEKIFHTSSLIEYYRQSVIIHINSTENIRSYTS